MNAQLVINGATLFLESGAIVNVQGNLSSTGDILGTGKIVMGGTSNQEMNMNGNVIPNLEINNAANVTLTGSAEVASTLLFTNGRILTGGNNFTFGPTATFSGENATRYIETNGIGQVRKELTAPGSYILPIGKSNAYMPLQYDLAGNTIGAGAYVAGSVVSAPHPNKPIRSEDYLTAYWKPTFTGVTGGTVNVTTTYTDANSFTGSETFLNGLRWDGADWSLAGNSINAATNLVTYNGVTSGSDLYAMNKFVLANAKVFLQGAFNGVNRMNDNLRAGTNLIPLTDPYRTAPYNSSFAHTNNTTGESVDPLVFSNQASDDKNIVDWVFLELRDPANVLIQTRSALLQKDGSIVDIDGVNPVYFKNLDAANYVVTVRHRNHLGIAADAATYAKSLSVARPLGGNMFDFTTASDAQIFGTSNAYKLQNGLNLMWGGNANGNNTIRYSGPLNEPGYILNTILAGNPSAVINNTYNIGDLNFNRNVRYTGPVNDPGFVLVTALEGTTTTVITQQIP